MNPSGVGLLDIGGYGDHHLVGRKGNAPLFPILERKHDFLRVDEAFDGLPFLKPLVGKCECLARVQAIKLGFKGWLGAPHYIWHNCY